MENIKLVCFDVDGTLVDGTSWLILTEGLGCSIQKHLDIFRKCRRGEIPFPKGLDILTKMYRESGNASKEFIKNLFDSVKVKDEAMNLISYLKEKGYRVYLISGAIDIYVESVAKKLGVDGFYANSSLKFDSKGILQGIKHRPNQGEVKLEQLQKLIRRLGINIEQVIFVGDSENDIDVFKATKHGITIHGSNEELEKVSWRIVNSLLDIKDIL